MAAVTIMQAARIPTTCRCGCKHTRTHYITLLRYKHTTSIKPSPPSPTTTPPSIITHITTIPKHAWHAWRNTPRATFANSYADSAYQWWILGLAYTAFGCIVMYKSYYQPITPHPTVIQTMQFVSQSQMYKQYCIDTHQTLPDTDHTPAAPLTRSTYHDGKHSYRKSHLIWKNYTPNGQTVYIAADGVNTSYIPKLDAATGQQLPVQVEQTMLSSDAKRQLHEQADWKLYGLRVWFTDVNRCYNYDFDRHAFVLSNNTHDTDMFTSKQSSAFIGSLGSDDATESSGIMTNQQLKQQAADRARDNSAQPKQSWNDYLSSMMTESRFLALSVLVSIPFGVGMYNRAIYRRTEGFRLIKQRLEQHRKLKTVFGADYTLANKYTGTVNREVANFDVAVNESASGRALGSVKIQAAHVDDGGKQTGVRQWRVSFAEARPDKGKPVSITV